MLKTKVFLYMSIILGLAIFFIRNIHLFLPKQNFSILSSVNLLRKQSLVLDNLEDKKLIDATFRNNIDNTFRKHSHLDVMKLVNVEKSSSAFLATSHEKKNQNVLKNMKTNSISSNKFSGETKNLKDKSKELSGVKKIKDIGLLTEVSLKQCPVRGSNLVGPLFIEQRLPSENDIKSQSILYGGTVKKGGWWSPSNCSPRIKVAIIIPFRQREEQLKIFLHHMHPILQRQQLFYRIIVVEQLENDPFNRAGLFNVGFVESLKISPFNCFIFTDVDLLPEDDRNNYGCPTSPRHMSVAVDKFEYRLPYATIFGGVGAFTRKHFEEINGMSNLFWGWGGEDDDLYKRITSVGLKLTRPSMLLGRYTMIKRHHFQSSKADPNRMNLLRNSKERMSVDGLNTLKYHLKEVLEDELVTYVKIQMKKQDYFQ